jgi:hypothetical protein
MENENKKNQLMKLKKKIKMQFLKIILCKLVMR